MFFALKVSIRGSGVEMLADYVKRKTERTPESL